MKMIPIRINSRMNHPKINRTVVLLRKEMILAALKKQPMMLNLKSKRMHLLQLKHLLPKQHHRLNLLSRIIKKKYLLPKLLMKMKLKTLSMRMPKQPHRKLELLPDLTSHRAIGNPS